jgi:hypothetical protein
VYHAVSASDHTDVPCTCVTGKMMQVLTYRNTVEASYEKPYLSIQGFSRQNCNEAQPHAALACRSYNCAVHQAGTHSCGGSAAGTH